MKLGLQKLIKESLFILPIQQYDTKIQNFINENHFQTINTGPTKTSHCQVRKTNHSETFIPQDSKCKYPNINPSARTTKAIHLKIVSVEVTESVQYLRLQ